MFVARSAGITTDYSQKQKCLEDLGVTWLVMTAGETIWSLEPGLLWYIYIYILFAYTCIYVYMYICIYVNKYKSIHVYMYICIFSSWFPVASAGTTHSIWSLANDGTTCKIRAHLLAIHFTFHGGAPLYKIAGDLHICIHWNGTQCLH